VHVAEIARANLKELGFAARALGQTFQGAAFPGNPFSLAIGAIGPVVANGVFGQTSPDFALAGSTIFLSSGNRDYAGVIRAMSDRNVLRTLAKPNLITQSGKEAKFLSGGEFPYPVAQQNNTISIEFKEFPVPGGAAEQHTPNRVQGVRRRPRLPSGGDGRRDDQPPGETGGVEPRL